MSVHRIFLSFSSEDSAWKQSFTRRDWFGDIIGNVDILDYKMGCNLEFGPLNRWLDEQIEQSKVFVAFLSESYIEKELPLREWLHALDEKRRRRLVFVPIILDSAAKSWWSDEMAKGNLRILGGDYNYADFTDDRGRPRPIIAEHGPIDTVTQRIGEIARLIRDHIEEQAAGDEQTIGEATLAPPAATGSIVILGHPTAVADPALMALSNDLAGELSKGGRAPLRWPNAWRRPAEPRQRQSCADAGCGAIFVQPLGEAEAGDLAAMPSQVRKWLGQALAQAGAAAGAPPDYRTVLWLPEGYEDRSFRDAATAAPADSEPSLRCDSVRDLAAWLRQLTQKPELPEMPVLTLEEVDAEDSGELREALHNGFHSVVGEVIRPAPERWTFQGDMLVDQIRNIESNRAIVAIHDLNTGTARGQREARQQLEQKLGAITCDVGRAMRLAGRKDLKLFWTALLVQKAEQLPWVKYPSPSQFENWCLLPFASGPADGQAGLIVHPKPGPKNVFRSYLRDWVRPAHP